MKIRKRRGHESDMSVAPIKQLERPWTSRNSPLINQNLCHNKRHSLSTMSKALALFFPSNLVTWILFDVKLEPLKLL